MGYLRALNHSGFSSLAVAMLLMLSAASAQAGLIITEESTTTNPFTAVSPDADMGIVFKDGNGNALVPLVGGTTSPSSGVIGDNWWQPNTFTIYTTGLPSTSHKIIIDLSDVNVYGFFGQFGANQSARGWVKAWEEGNSTPASLSDISLGPNHSPAFSVTNMEGSCNRITKVVIEPPFTWGAFNMGADFAKDSCSQVPEPGSLSLLGAGLLGLGLLQRARRRSKPAPDGLV